MAQISPKVVLPVLMVVAFGAAWLVMPSTDLGPEPAAPVAVESKKPEPRADPFAVPPTQQVPGWVAAEPPPPEVAEAIERYQERAGDRPWKSMQERLRGMEGKQSNKAGAAMGRGREVMMQRRAEGHLANAGGRARSSTQAWMDDLDMSAEDRDRATSLVDDMDASFGKIQDALDDGTLDADDAMKKAEIVSDSTLKKLEKLTGEQAPPGVDKAFASPQPSKPPPTGPADAEVPPDGWWDGEPLDWGAE